MYRKGLSSREKVQELPGMDPIFVVKTPTLFGTRPAGVKLPADGLRSTRILVHGKWAQVEDRVPPLLQQSRGLTNGLNEHASSSIIPLLLGPVVSLPARVPATGRFQGRKSMGFQRLATMELSHPSLTFGTETLFEQAQRHQKIPYS